MNDSYMLPVVHALCVRWTPGYRIRHPGVQRACEHGLQELLLSSMLVPRSTPAWGGSGDKDWIPGQAQNDVGVGQGHEFTNPKVGRK